MKRLDSPPAVQNVPQCGNGLWITEQKLKNKPQHGFRVEVFFTAWNRLDVPLFGDGELQEVVCYLVARLGARAPFENFCKDLTDQVKATRISVFSSERPRSHCPPGDSGHLIGICSEEVKCSCS